MFDISFWELALVMLVGLVVLGPQKLPIAIRTVMGWVRTIRGLASNVQSELAQELKLQELQESIKKAEALNLDKLSPELGKTVADLRESAQKMQANLSAAEADVKREVAKLSDEQVAEIQQTIEAESQALQQEVAQAGQNSQNSAKNDPLPPQNEQADSALYPDELAELAEENDPMAAYYPPDDELANPVDAEKPNVRQ